MSCSYCGSPFSSDRDHVIPQSYLRYGKRRFDGDWTVPSCRECNSLLRDELIFNVPDRARYLIAKYLKRYKKELSFTSWDEEDLEDVSDNLRLMVEASEIFKKEIEQRLDHLRIVSEMPEDYLV